MFEPETPRVHCSAAETQSEMMIDLIPNQPQNLPFQWKVREDMLAHKIQSAPQVDTWPPCMAFLTSVLPQCSMPSSEEGQHMF